MEPAELELAETFGAIARSLHAEGDVAATLRRIVDTAISLVEGCEHAGIDIIEGRTIRGVAPSDGVAERIDAIQTEVGEGPCLSAIRDHEVFSSDDLEHEDRWPHFARRAFEETGVRSMMGFRLFAEVNTMGALDLYSTQAKAFDDDTAAIGSVLAAHASVALAAAREREQLRAAIESRDLIGEAKGILMARSNVDEDQAFDMLRRASQRLNIKLRTVADQIVHPEAHPPPPEG